MAPPAYTLDPPLLARGQSMVSSIRPIHARPPTPTNFISNQPICRSQEHKKKHMIENAETIKFQNNQLFCRKIFKSIDDFICNFIDLPLAPSIDPKLLLSGNFAPVEELPPTACEVVEGRLPTCLDGAYIRNGPNPQFIPRGPYHLFDGDGMLHMIKISGNQATFCSRYVKTYKFTVEREIGHPVFPSAFSSFNGVFSSAARVVLAIARALAGEFDPVKNGYGTANTHLAFISGKLYALVESDLPYEIQITSDGDLITLRRHDFHAHHPFDRMTAHPIIDPETGEAFAFRYDVVPPFITFFRIDSDGMKQPDVPIFSMKSAAVIHDFAVTKSLAVFNDLQMVMSPLQILKGRQPIIIDPVKIPRLGVIDRYAEDDKEMWWIDVPGVNMLHIVNAWEEDDGDTLVVVGTNLLSVEEVLESLDRAGLTLEMLRVSVKEKKVVSRRQLCSQLIAVAIVNNCFTGKKTRYIYAAVVVPPVSVAGVIKIDTSLSAEGFHECVVASRMYEQGCTGNEPFFVAAEPSEGGEDEDNGFLVTYVHDENREESKFLVMDAKSPTLEIVAAVKLPGRVPTGFHGIFVNESHIPKQY